MNKEAIKKPRMGRPPKISRQQILECALGLLEQGPTKVTLSGVAKALKTAPMTLYTHVENRDDLIRGVSDLVLGRIEVTIDESDIWQDQIRAWVYQVHEQLARFPQVVQLIGEEQSIPLQWLRVQAILVRAMARAGFEGAVLAHGSRWLSQIVVSKIILDRSENTVLQDDTIVPMLEELEPEDRDTIGLVLPYVHHTEQSFFDYVVEQAVARLEASL